MKKLLIFDLDGTLADTIESIRHAINLAAEKFGYPEKSYDEVRAAIGDGAMALMRRVMPQGDAENDSAVKKFLACYEAMYDVTYSEADKCYDGIPEALEALKERGYTIAVLSNKQDNYVKLITSEIIKDGIASLAAGQLEGYPTKPDPTVPLLIADKLGFSAENTVFIGDGETDVMTAKNAGMVSVGCAWGYRGKEVLAKYGADYIISKPSELLDILN
ncbi:MAG: HAD family hydrolase [Clostridia bacterium]|nr:HAD family hydrolase [Clostridia bacterium]